MPRGLLMATPLTLLVTPVPLVRSTRASRRTKTVAIRGGVEIMRRKT